MEFRVLGPVEVHTEEGPLRLPGGMQRALLALLLLDPNRGVSAERLMDQLWGENLPPTAAASLQNQISRLRKALGADRLVSVPGGYSLRVEDGELDSVRFERLVDGVSDSGAETRGTRLGEALALWRGGAFENVEAEAVRHEARRLEERRLAAVEERLEAELSLGRHAAVVPELEALAAAHPLRERVHGLLILALYRAGRQVEALDRYRELRRRLADELGLDPSPSLRKLEQAILAHDESVAVDFRPAALERQPVQALVRRARSRRGLVLAAVAALVALVAATLLLLRSDDPSIGPNTIALLDPGSGRVVAGIPVGRVPGELAFGDGALWAASIADETLARIDPRTRKIAETIALDFAPGAVAAGEGGVWVADPTGGTVAKVTPGEKEPGEILYIGVGGPGAMPLATGWGSLWVGNENDFTLSRVVAPDGDVVSLIRDAPARSVAVTETEVWMLDASRSRVWRIDPVTDTVVAQTRVGRDSTSLAADAKSVWITDTAGDRVWWLDGVTGALRKSFPVGQDPRAVALAGDSVWVANSSEGSVSRIDRRTGEITTIDLGARVGGIAFGGGFVWVAVA